MSSPAAATQNKVVKSLLRIDINIYTLYIHTLYTHTYIYMYSGTGYDLWRQARRLTQLATRGAAWLLWFRIEIVVVKRMFTVYEVLVSYNMFIYLYRGLSFELQFNICS